MGDFCQRLKAFVGFRDATVEVFPSQRLLLRSDYRALGGQERSERIMGWVHWGKVYRSVVL